MNKVTEFCANKNWIGLLDYLLVNQSDICLIYGDRIGKVLRNINFAIREQPNDQHKQLFDKYFELRKLVNQTHPMANLVQPNIITQYMQEEKYIELMDHFLQHNDDIRKIANDRVGLVLARIKSQVNAIQDNEELFKSRRNDYVQLRQLVANLHPSSDKLATDQEAQMISKLQSEKNWLELHNYFVLNPKAFYEKTHVRSRGNILANIRREVYNIQDEQIHTQEYIKFKQLINKSK